MFDDRRLLQKILYFLRWQLGTLFVSLPGHLAFVLRGVRGRCGLFARLSLAANLVRIHLRIRCAHGPLELLSIVEEIVELPDDVRGPIVECGCYLGGSTAKLSHAAAFVGRRLFVCDSFEGLPEPTCDDSADGKEDFQKGEYGARMSKVRDNLSHLGKLDSVEFLPGWFSESLPTLRDTHVACVFLDVDLQSSVRDCLKVLWPRLEFGGKLFVHDVDRPGVCQPFQDVEWWSENVPGHQPELVGALTGLGWQRPLLGYALKVRQ